MMQTPHDLKIGDEVKCINRMSTNKFYEGLTGVVKVVSPEWLRIHWYKPDYTSSWVRHYLTGNWNLKKVSR